MFMSVGSTAPVAGGISEGIGVDTCDGTGIARYSEWREAIAERHDQQSMFT